MGHRPAPRAAISRSAGGFGAGPARRNAAPWARWAADRKAPPRGGAEPARARHEVRHADTMADQMQIYKYCVHNVAHSLRQDRDLHAEADLRRQRLGHACHQSIWKAGKPLFAGNGYADLSETCLYYIGGIIKHAKAINAFTNPLDQQLQAPDPGLRGAGAAGLFGAQPLGLLPHPLHHQPEGQARRGALPRPDGQPLSRLRGDADGRPGRHQEQDPSGRARWTRTSTTCRRKS
jgi:hypothetical protein